MNESILIVDDEKEIADLIEVYLKNDGYTVHKFYNGLDALGCIKTQKMDLAILDVMLPDIDGFRICQKIREQYFYPIIILTAKVEDTDKIMGLTIGADDYITKPYNPTILLLRIQNIFKRMEISKEDMNYDGIIVNPKKGILEKDGKTLELTKNEMIIFSFLLSNRGKIVTRDDLMTDLWNNNEFINDNALTVNISRLRSKLQDFGLENKIETRKGQGYKLL